MKEERKEKLTITFCGDRSLTIYLIFFKAINKGLGQKGGGGAGGFRSHFFHPPTLSDIMSKIYFLNAQKIVKMGSGSLLNLCL